MFYSIGHSNLDAGAFGECLVAHGISALVDVRRFPSSRRFPHFAARALDASLASLGISYRHDERLGGRREPTEPSPHVALPDAGFRGYADHMASPEFRSALDLLVTSGAGVSTAIMCAEADPARCHRRMIADALIARGVEVRHVRDAARADVHVPPPYLRVAGDRLVYDGGMQTLDLGGRRR